MVLPVQVRRATTKKQVPKPAIHHKTPYSQEERFCSFPYSNDTEIPTSFSSPIGRCASSAVNLCDIGEINTNNRQVTRQPSPPISSMTVRPTLTIIFTANRHKFCYWLSKNTYCCKMSEWHAKMHGYLRHHAKWYSCGKAIPSLQIQMRRQSSSCTLNGRV